MTTDRPARQNKKDRRDLNLFTGGITAFAVLWISTEIIQMLYQGIAISRLSPAVDGGITFSELPSGAQWLYGISFTVKYIALVATALTLSMLTWNMSHDRVFTQRNVALLDIASYSMAGYFLARMGGEGLANNWAAATFGIDSWGETGSGTPMSEMTPVLLLLFTLATASILIRRGAKLEEDVDGLV